MIDVFISDWFFVIFAFVMSCRSSGHKTLSVTTKYKHRPAQVYQESQIMSDHAHNSKKAITSANSGHDLPPPGREHFRAAAALANRTESFSLFPHPSQ